MTFMLCCARGDGELEAAFAGEEKKSDVWQWTSISVTWDSGFVVKIARYLQYLLLFCVVVMEEMPRQ